MHNTSLSFSRSADSASPQAGAANNPHRESPTTARLPADSQSPRYGTIRALSLLALLSLSQTGLAQTAPTREDSLKGRIWTATARRVWADEKVDAPLKAWPTGSDFNKWVLTQKPDKTELGSLFGAVLTRVGPGQPASPAQVAQAILAEVSQRKTSKTGALAKVNVQALQADLQPFAAITSTPPTAAPDSPTAAPATSAAGTNSTTVTAVPGATGLTALPADTARPPAPTRQPATPEFTSTPVAPRYFGLPANLAGLVLLLAGGLLGLGLGRSMRSRRHRRRPHDHAEATEPDITDIMNSQEYRKLQRQNRNLHTQLLSVQKQLEDLQAQISGRSTNKPNRNRPTSEVNDTTGIVFSAAPTPTELPSIEELVGASTNAPAPAATRYGPVQETPFLEERKIVDSPLPQLALMLTVNSRDPSQATFTLNPQVDQARLIGDGLTRLQKFFDYDPPLGGRITSVAAVRPGRLQRHESGWQVVERARLAIS